MHLYIKLFLLLFFLLKKKRNKNFSFRAHHSRATSLSLSFSLSLLYSFINNQYNEIYELGSNTYTSTWVYNSKIWAY